MQVPGRRISAGTAESVQGGNLRNSSAARELRLSRRQKAREASGDAREDPHRHRFQPCAGRSRPDCPCRHGGPSPIPGTEPRWHGGRLQLARRCLEVPGHRRRRDPPDGESVERRPRGVQRRRRIDRLRQRPRRRPQPLRDEERRQRRAPTHLRRFGGAAFRRGRRWRRPPRGLLRVLARERPVPRAAPVHGAARGRLGGARVRCIRLASAGLARRQVRGHGARHQRVASPRLPGPRPARHLQPRPQHRPLHAAHRLEGQRRLGVPSGKRHRLPDRSWQRQERQPVAQAVLGSAVRGGHAAHLVRRRHPRPGGLRGRQDRAVLRVGFALAPRPGHSRRAAGEGDGAGHRGRGRPHAPARRGP